MKRAWWAGVVGLLALAGCGSRDFGDGGAVPGVLRFDAAMIGHRDAAVPDDAAVLRDAGLRDAGPRDAGGRPDAYVPPRDAGTTVRTCTGVATSCSLVGTYGCTSQQGCYLGGECTGSARYCSSYFSSYSCSRQEGCYWSSYSEYCSGISRSCYGYTGSASCTYQEGCSWRTTCEGSAWSCSLLTASECLSQDGCYLR
ncbi:MAG: hypothetical protein IT378_14810 [Sandaracinaceae bacterium]|nr:hypothetical protein [Sandaracinaceae bacterium]